LHKRPDAGEIQACKWWLKIEKHHIKPKIIVALGATAALSLTGNGRDILKRRGSFETADDGTPILITVHPSSLLRAPDPEAAAKAKEQFRLDLARIAKRLRKAA
jgi:DNA polymerase